MNSGGRYVVSLCMGLAAALLGWAVLELVLSFRGVFPSYRLLLFASGGFTAAAMTAVLASLEGILHKDTVKIHKEWSLGLIWGFAGGVLGAFLGQMIFLLILPENVMPESHVYPFYAARIISWSIMGAFIGTAEGLRSRSGLKVQAGLISGVLAGLLGGSIVETAMMFFPDDSWLKLPGFMVLGIGAAFLTVVIEEKSAPGVFRVLNGSSKGRKYLLNQKKIVLGSSNSSDIFISGSSKIPPSAVMLKRKGKEIILSPIDDFPVFINDESCREQTLKYEDVIKVGDVKFMYEVKQ